MGPCGRHVILFDYQLGQAYGFATSFIAISRICIIGLGLLDVLPIGTTTKQKQIKN
jgi:hypothetical protein